MCFRTLGFCRRRIGRGGRILTDRATHPNFPTLPDHVILSNSDPELIPILPENSNIAQPNSQIHQQVIFLYDHFCYVSIFFGFSWKILRQKCLRLHNSDINSQAGGWSLWRLFNINLSYSDLQLNFWPRITLNQLNKKYFRKFAWRHFSFQFRSFWILVHWILILSEKFFFTFLDPHN